MSFCELFMSINRFDWNLGKQKSRCITAGPKLHISGSYREMVRCPMWSNLIGFRFHSISVNFAKSSKCGWKFFHFSLICSHASETPISQVVRCKQNSFKFILISLFKTCTSQINAYRFAVDRIHIGLSGSNWIDQWVAEF